MVILFMSGYFLGQWVLKTEHAREYDDIRFKGYISSVKQTKGLSKNFNKIFNTICPNARTNEIKSSYKDYVWNHFTGVYPRRKQGNDFYSLKVSSFFNQKDIHIKWESLLNQDLVLAYGLEQHLSPSKCVDFYFNNFTIEIPARGCYTSKKLIGINEISQFYFNKPIPELNQTEIIEIIARIDCYRLNHTEQYLTKRIQILKRVFEKNNT